MSLCEECNQPVEPGSRSCPNCGASVEQAEPTVIVPPRDRRPQREEADSASAGSIHGRFEPGARLGTRYRIVGLLGRGGMGEVYRADDLELGQSVALKFLPERVANDPVALDRFRSEVRTARQIAHPNVCRIYDIAEQDGHVFLSMEYIDGEDLAGVLRRLGRPSREKAIEIARQICLGLAAAHENSVLHRDLKPANIMIDGRGRARITDFGLAGLADEFEQSESRAGTPAYMAPEQLAHGKVSARSDIYSLGLILHELFTGKRVFDTNDIEELKRKHSSGTVATPSSTTNDIDPAVERVIMRCLEQRPEQRPQSVYQVLAALPGGDPLEAALAAGETPSPELVANAGERGGLSRGMAMLLAIWIAAVAVVAIMISANWIIPSERGVVLATRAADIAHELGYEDLPQHTAWGFDPNIPYLKHRLAAGDTSWDGLSGNLSAAVVFWCRWSPSPLMPLNLHQPFASFNDPPQSTPGSITVVLNRAGHLTLLNVEPQRSAMPVPNLEEPWQVLLKLAGLTDPSIELTELENRDALTGAIDPLEGVGPSQHLPPIDETREWSISAPEAIGSNLIARAGIFQGRPVYLSIRENQYLLGARPGQENETSSTFVIITTAFDLTQDLLWPVILIFAAVLAIRNVRGGRVDHQGAMRSGVLMFGLYLIMEMSNFPIGDQGVTGLLNEMTGGRSIGHALLHGIQLWVSYLALEPYVRRIWPHLLVGWVRLISGRWRDPLVGREILIGMSLGAVIYLVGPIGADKLAEVLGFANFPQVPNSWATLGITAPAKQLYLLCLVMTTPLLTVMFVLLLLLVLRMLTRKIWIVVVAAILLHSVACARWLFGVFNNPESPLLFTGTMWSLVYAAVISLALLRFGLVCALAAHVSMTLLWWMVGATEFGDWHAAPMMVQLMVLGALVAYGFWVSLAGRPIFKDMLAEPQSPE